MKKKTNLTIALGLIIIGLCIGICVAINYLQEDKNVCMRIVIYPSGLSETYYFVIRNDGSFEASFGTRKNYDIKTANLSNFFMSKPQRRKRMLTEKEVADFIDLANKIDASNEIYKEEIMTDSWSTIFMYKGKFYEMNYNDKSKKLRELVDMVIKFSPINVNLRGFA